jgi:hypothetical protein
MADGRGKQPSKNSPSKGTPADKRKAGRGAKPGPKPKAETPFRITAKSWLPGAQWSLSGATDAYVVEADTVMDA